MSEQEIKELLKKTLRPLLKKAVSKSLKKRIPELVKQIEDCSNDVAKVIKNEAKFKAVMQSIIAEASPKTLEKLVKNVAEDATDYVDFQRNAIVIYFDELWSQSISELLHGILLEEFERRRKRKKSK